MKSNFFNNKKNYKEKEELNRDEKTVGKVCVLHATCACEIEMGEMRRRKINSERGGRRHEIYQNQSNTFC